MDTSRGNSTRQAWPREAGAPQSGQLAAILDVLIPYLQRIYNHFTSLGHRFDLQLLVCRGFSICSDIHSWQARNYSYIEPSLKINKLSNIYFSPASHGISGTKLCSRHIQSELSSRIRSKIFCAEKKSLTTTVSQQKLFICQLVYLIISAPPLFLPFFFPSPTHCPSSLSSVISQGVQGTARWFH